VTGPNGHYRLEGLIAGRLLLTAVRPGEQVGSSANVDVSEGETAQHDFILASAGTVHGVVTRENHGSVEGALVTAFSSGPGGSGIATVPVEEGGRYALTLTPGSYQVVAHPERTGSSFTPGLSSHAKVTVSAGEDVTQDLVLPDPSTLSFTGTVLEPEGTPSAGAMVIGISASGMMAMRTTDASGRFTLAFAGMESGPLTLHVRNGGRVGIFDGVDPSREVTVTLQAAGKLRGRVVGAADPRGRFTVSWSAAGDLGGHGELSFVGERFELNELPAGKLDVTLQTEAGQTAETQVTVSPGQTTDLEVRLEEGARVVGRLLDPRGQPISEAVVLVDGRVGPGDQPTLSAADGRFALVHLPSGAHHLVVISDRNGTLDRDLQLEDRAEVDLGDLVIGGGHARPAP
jgi:hypothetical protein